MKHLLLALAALLSPAVLAQAGLPDPTFGTDGVVRLEPQNQAEGWAVRALPDGRVRVAGLLDDTAVVYGFDASGAPDGTFGIDGVASTGIVGMHASDLHVFPSGRIVVVARPYRGSGDAGSAFVGFTADGALDPSFGDGGTVASTTFWRAIAADGDGFVALGNGSFALPEVVARFDADGAPDLTYGTDGRVTLLPDEPPYAFQVLIDIAVDASGRAVLLGYTSTGTFDVQLVAARLTPGGAPDPTFGTDGVARPDVFCCLRLDFDRLRVALDAQNRVVLAFGGGVARLDTQGNPDLSFGTDGVTLFGTEGFITETANVAVQPDGKIVVAGHRGTAPINEGDGFLAARLMPDGALDSTFGTDGLTVLPFAGQYHYEWAFGLDLAPNGDIILAGHRSETSYSGDRVIVARLTGDLGVTAEPRAAGGVLALRHAGANPSAAGRVALHLDAPQSVRITAYDALGRAVGMLHDGPLAAGEQAFALGDLAPGIYLVRAVATDGAAAVLSATVAR